MFRCLFIINSESEEKGTLIKGLLANPGSMGIDTKRRRPNAPRPRQLGRLCILGCLWGCFCLCVCGCVCVFVFTFLLAPEFLNTLEVFVFVWHVGWGLRENQAGFSLRIHRVLCPLQSLQRHKDGSLYERRIRRTPHSNAKANTFCQILDL